ncbi:MAG TPA: hypothetical protein VD994_04390, partial [Prosthecobacter sp.]|nr:hypothetical protein [Prosthecobacter sp.]
MTASCMAAVAFMTPEAQGQAGYAASHYAAQQVQPNPYQPPSYQQQMAAYEPRYQEIPPAAPVVRAVPASLVSFDGRYATPSMHLPIQVQYAVNAANYLQHKPYVYGGGHQSIESRSYDCSSAVSYALIKGGMLRTPLTSTSFARFGA